MKIGKQKAIQIGIVSALFIVILVFAAAHSLSTKTSSHSQTKSTTRLSTTVPTPQSTQTLVPLVNNSTTTLPPETTLPFNTDDETPQQIQTGLDAQSSPFDAATTANLKQQASAAVMAFLTGTGRANFPVLWPDDTSGSDANFTTAQIDASGVTAGTSSTATIAVYWQSADLANTNYPQISLVYAQLTNGDWQITKVQT